MLLEMFRRYGVDTVFGLPERPPWRCTTPESFSDIRHVLVGTSGTTSSWPTYAGFRRPGVCEEASVGAPHMVPGLLEARKAPSLIALTTDIPLHMGSETCSRGAIRPLYRPCGQGKPYHHPPGGRALPGAPGLSSGHLGTPGPRAPAPSHGCAGARGKPRRPLRPGSLLRLSRHPIRSRPGERASCRRSSGRRFPRGPRGGAGGGDLGSLGRGASRGGAFRPRRGHHPGRQGSDGGNSPLGPRRGRRPGRQ